MHPYVRSGLMTLGVVTALGLLVAGFVASDTEDVTLPPEIQSIAPAHDELVGAVGDIGVDLVDDHTGVLLVDGVEIPEDQLTRVDSLGQIYFRPGEALEFERLEAGSHSATVIFWLRTETRDQAESFTWRFRVGS